MLHHNAYALASARSTSCWWWEWGQYETTYANTWALTSTFISHLHPYVPAAPSAPSLSTPSLSSPQLQCVTPHYSGQLYLFRLATTLWSGMSVPCQSTQQRVTRLTVYQVP